MNPLTRSVNELRENDCQWKAFETEDHCVVIAPPGSGKTKLVATRVAFDLVNRIPAPHGAACITLTNPAADQLRQRISALGTEPRSTLFIGTVHGFALSKIIKPFAAAAGRSDIAGLSIADPTVTRKILRRSIDEVFGSQDQRLVKTTIDYNRKRMADTEDWAHSGPGVAEAAHRYEKGLRNEGLMDFDDAIRFAVELVEENKFIRRVLTACYPRLYVDEYQDLAPGLDRLVRALCFDYANPAVLFAVGDPDQAILGFTGTRPELLDELASMPRVTPVELKINYRCGVEIIHRARLLLDNPQREVVGQRMGGSVQAHRESAGFEAQVESAASIARAANAKGTPLHEIVVLCPTNDECARAATLFRSRGVPSYVRGSEYERTPVNQMIEAMAAWATLGRERSGHRLGDLLRRWRDALGPRWEWDCSVQLVSGLLRLADHGKEPAHRLLYELDELGLTDSLKKASRGDEAGPLASMQAALTDGRLKLYSIEDLAERARNVDRVEVTTMTSGKGLEFDVVLILGAEEGVIPHFSSRYDTAKMREDRRKFYVSVTRARYEVDIFYSGFNITTWGNIKRDGPSRFIRQLGLIT
jgi:DNA helicase-2/ATP-dependent DNA helicase PcrA